MQDRFFPGPACSPAVLTGEKDGDSAADPYRASASRSLRAATRSSIERRSAARGETMSAVTGVSPAATLAMSCGGA